VASRSGAPRGYARSGVTKGKPTAKRKPSAVAPSLENIAELIDNGGQISIGRSAPIECAAVANDEDNCLVMLQRRPGETLPQLLERLDAAIALASDGETFIDEINPS
jgi:hypothetical protein